MNGPFLLIRATYGFARVGYGLFIRLLGARGKTFFWGGVALSAVVATYLQVTH